MLMLYSIFKARRVIFLSPRAANYCSCNIPLIVWKIEKGNHAAIKNIRYLLHNLVLTLPMSAKSNQMCGDENTEEVVVTRMPIGGSDATSRQSRRGHRKRSAHG